MLGNFNSLSVNNSWIRYFSKKYEINAWLMSSNFSNFQNQRQYSEPLWKLKQNIDQIIAA